MGCMGPPPNVHGGCIFSLHAESVISCMRLLASGYECSPSRGSLTSLSVNYRKLTPLWQTYCVHVRIIQCCRDTANSSWTFHLRSEMTNPNGNVVHSDADAEFTCCAEGNYEFLTMHAEQPIIPQASSRTSML